MNAKGVTAVVLAGGNSTRMGQNKALLKIGSETLIEIVVNKLKQLFDEVIIVTNNPENYSMLKNIKFQKDLIKTPVKNSLVGIYTGLIASSNDKAFVVACDMPFLNESLIQYMVHASDLEDVIVPYLDGHYEPLHAIYNKTCLTHIHSMIQLGNYKIINLYDNVETKKIPKDKIKSIDPKIKSFMNINTKEVYDSLDHKSLINT